MPRHHDQSAGDGSAHEIAGFVYGRRDGLLEYPVPAATPVYGAPQGALKEEIVAFVRAVRREIPVPVTMAEAADAVRVATAIDQAVSSHAEVQVAYPE